MADIVYMVALLHGAGMVADIAFQHILASAHVVFKIYNIFNILGFGPFFPKRCKH